MKTWLTMTAAVSCMLAVSGAALAMDEGIAREGAGERRERLNAMELAPFNADLWSSLQSWSGAPITKDSMKDKVVVIVTWASWARASHDALRVAQQIQERYGDRGLIVVGIHHQQGFEGAAKLAEGRGVTFTYAHDASGAFRSGLEVDQDPDFYVIDRAGNMRFADIETSSAEAAARLLVRETAADAAARPQKLADKAAEDEARQRMTRPVSGDVKPGKILIVPFTLPDASAFAAAAWPDVNPNPGAGDHQGKPMPAQFGNEVWITEKAPMKGRVVVLDFWATWCGPCVRAMPALDSLQNAHMQDLAIVAISGSSRGDRYKEDPASIRQFLRSHRSSYYHANDLKHTLASAIGVQGIPHVVVISTDGVVRWQGNPHDSNFRKAVEQVIRVDPGVKARRAAEARLSG